MLDRDGRSAADRHWRPWMMRCDGCRSGWCDRWIPSQRRPLTMPLGTLLTIGIFLKTNESCHLSTRQASVTVSVGTPVILNCSCVYPNGSGMAGFVQWVRKNQTIFLQKNITHWQWRNVSDQSKRESFDFSIAKWAMLSDAGVYSCQFWKKNSPDVLNGTVNVTLSVNASFSTEFGNFWLHLATTTNTTSFCVNTADSPSHLLANNLIGIRSSREEFTSITGLSITSLEIDNVTCLLFTVPWQLNQTSYREFHPLNGTRAPKRWVFLCSQYAFTSLAPTISATAHWAVWPRRWPLYFQRHDGDVHRLRTVMTLSS
nr:uncharacterized protein LOC127488725 [Oryctolagus cuniculus]